MPRTPSTRSTSKTPSKINSRSSLSNGNESGRDLEEENDSARKTRSKRKIKDIVQEDTVPLTLSIAIPQKKFRRSDVTDHYELGEVVGKGGFSEVVKAISRKTGATVAVKIVHCPSSAEKNHLSGEISILQKLPRHPHIVEFFESFEDDKYIYFVLEFISGGELFDRIVQKKSYNEKEARDVMKILLDTVGHCHIHNIVHRDLKPENLVLKDNSDNSAIKLIDFGAAAEIGPFSELTGIIGTTFYMAPEILMKRPYGKAVDMWSIGVILFALLSGTLPFNEKNEGATQELIKRGHFHFRASPIWRNITSSAKNLIQSFLHVDPNKRLNCRNALHHDWFQIPDHILASKSLDDVLPELKKFQAKKRWKKAMLSVVALNRFKSFSRNASREVPATPMEGVTTETLSGGENPAHVYLSLSHSNDFQLEKFQPTLPPLPPDQEEEESDAAATTLGDDRFLLFETEVLKKERNGYVTTFKGMNKETNETVAIKKILLSRLSSREIASYRNEVEILRTLSLQDHSHLKEFEGKSVTTLDTQIIQFYDSYFDEKENILYIVTELIDGSELFDRIYQKKYYHEKQARDLVKPLLIALHSMHSKGIIHRHLRPENLFLTSDSEDAKMKILNFSTAIFSDSQNHRGSEFHLEVNRSSFSEVCFSAPELLSGRGYSTATDMWSFGVLMYLIFFGRLPSFHKNLKHSADNRHSCPFVHCSQCYELVLPTDCLYSGEAADFFRRCLTVDPRNRMTTQDALKHEWFGLEDWEIDNHRLNNSILHLKRFQIRRKFRVCMQALLLIVRVKLLLKKEKSTRLPQGNSVPTDVNAEKAEGDQSCGDGTGDEGFVSRQSSWMDNLTNCTLS